MSTSRIEPIGSLSLSNGSTLADVAIAYVRYGQLADDGSNAILITHGYTASHQLLAHGSGVAEGAWSGLIGPGKPLDTQRYCILCPNMLGSCYGSTGPASTDPATGKAYGRHFPDITFSDIVASQRRLLERLGVRHLRAVVGPSLGGFQALQWAIDHPDFVDAVGAIVSGPYLPPSEAMSLSALMRTLQADPAWQDGDTTPGALSVTLPRLRLATLRTYGMPQVLAAEGLDATIVEARLERMAADWARSFNPHSLIVLLKAALAFDVRPHLPQVHADVLHVVASSDALFPPDPKVRQDMQRIRGRLHYLELDTALGHSSSGPLHTQWGPLLRDMLHGSA